MNRVIGVLRCYQAFRKIPNIGRFTALIAAVRCSDSPDYHTHPITMIVCVESALTKMSLWQVATVKKS